MPKISISSKSKYKFISVFPLNQYLKKGLRERKGDNEKRKGKTISTPPYIFRYFDNRLILSFMRVYEKVKISENL